MVILQHQHLLKCCNENTHTLTYIHENALEAFKYPHMLRHRQTHGLISLLSHTHASNIYMCTHIHACTRAHTHTHAHTRTHTQSLNIWTQAQICEQVHTQGNIQTYTYLHIIYTNVHTQAQAWPTYTGIAHMHTHKNLQTHRHTCTQMQRNTHKQVHTHMYTNIYTCTKAHTHACRHTHK